MELIAGVKTFIFMLSGIILNPVLFLLAGLALWILFECGTLLAEWIRRRRLREGELPFPVAAYRRELEALLEKTSREADVQNLLLKAEQKHEGSLDKFRIAVRIGPALGLMGTLIPMGTALASLGQGDLSVMSSELVLAYTTTVAGLLSGSAAYVICTVRRRFVASDVREMEYLTERLFDEIHAQK